MKAYVANGSPNCRKVLATIKALDLSVEIEQMDFAGGDLRKPEFLAVNPNGLVPALEDGDFTLWESNAIMQYLASRVPGNQLFPDDPAKRADISRWQCWDLAHFGRAVSTISFERMIKPRFFNQEPDEAVIEAGVRDFHRFAPVLNGQLEGRHFVVGDSATLADFSLVAPLMYAETGGVPWDNYRHLKAWAARLDDVPAWAATAPSGM